MDLSLLFLIYIVKNPGQTLDIKEKMANSLLACAAMVTDTVLPLSISENQ